MPIKFNDLSGKISRDKSSGFLRVVQDKQINGIVEYFPFSTRCVILLPQQSTIIRMNLMALRCPDPKERIGDEALTFSNNNFLLRDCEVIIRDIDRNGIFNGNLWIQDGRQVICTELKIVSNGYADLRGSSNRHPEKVELELALNEAKKQKKGMWADETKTVESLEEGEVYECNVTAIWDPCTVVIQKQSDELKKINEYLVKAKERITTNLMKGDLVAAIFQRKIYRGRVVEIEKRSEMIKIEFIELCVTDYLPISDLRVLPNEISNIPPQALSVRLACCKAFTFSDDFNKEVEDFLWKLVENQTLYAHLIIDDMTAPDPDVLLTDSPDINSGSLNSMVLSKGYCKFNYLQANGEVEADIVTLLESIELAARQHQVGAWRPKEDSPTETISGDKVISATSLGEADGAAINEEEEYEYEYQYELGYEYEELN
jgi:hypothetical protein